MSDWSSDVCSSDLPGTESSRGAFRQGAVAVQVLVIIEAGHPGLVHPGVVGVGAPAHEAGLLHHLDGACLGLAHVEIQDTQAGHARCLLDAGAPGGGETVEIGRASCRERWVSTCGFGWSAYH